MLSIDFKGFKDAVCAGIGIVGAFIAQLFGGWNAAMTTLLIFMGIDYITGMIVAGVFHKSKKSFDGRLESHAGWKGLCKKGFTFVIVLIACRLDIVIGSTFIRDATVVAFIANETISIIENAGLMGLPIPRVIVSAISVLKGKAHESEKEIHKMAKDAEKKMEEDNKKEAAEESQKEQETPPAASEDNQEANNQTNI